MTLLNATPGNSHVSNHHIGHLKFIMLCISYISVTLVGKCYSRLRIGSKGREKKTWDCKNLKRGIFTLCIYIEIKRYNLQLRFTRLLYTQCFWSDHVYYLMSFDYIFQFVSQLQINVWNEVDVGSGQTIALREKENILKFS